MELNWQDGTTTAKCNTTGRIITKPTKNFKQRYRASSGSFVNMLMANNSSVPVIGEGATELMYTDRHAYTVIDFDPKRKTAKIQRCDPKRTDNLGMSDAQCYDYSKHTDEILTLKYRYNNWYVQYINQWTQKTEYRKIRIIFGIRDEHFDFSF